jgi:hypothetical protein
LACRPRGRGPLSSLIAASEGGTTIQRIHRVRWLLGDVVGDRGDLEAPVRPFA